jgi:mannitol/fructose-specific phosphotransferase system IIA component (Ntr-type)
MALALTDLLDDKHVALELRGRTKTNALREIVRLLEASEKIREPAKFLEQVLARERANPSLIEHGVAFPHARTDLVDQILLGIGRSRAGVPFGRKGGRAHLIFLIGVPQQLINDYLINVGTLARLTKNDATRAALMRAKTSTEFVDLLRQAL